MSLIFQISQISYNYISSWVKTKRNIILFKVLSSLSAVLMLVSVGEYMGALPVGFTAIRSILFMYKDKFKTNKVLYGCISAYVIIAIFSIQGLTDLLPTVISITASIIIWYCEPIGIKVGLSITDSIWILYYLIVGLYLSAFNNVIQVLISIISIFDIKKNLKNTKLH